MFYVFVCIFFFFKQKTAYELRISDWSSDVCSSDLAVVEVHRQRDQRLVSLAGLADEVLDLTLVQQELSGTTWRMVVPRALRVLRNVQRAQPHFAEIGRASCRERVCQNV